MTNKLVSDKDREVFNDVTEIWDNLRQSVLGKNTFKPMDTLSDWLSRLTGDYMYLTTRYTEVSVTRRNNEVAKYITLKKDAQVAGEKFVSAVAEREARNEIAEFAEAEHVFESYKDAAQQGILTIKKLIDVQTLELQREVN